MKPQGYKCTGSGYGHPHGKDKHIERVKRAAGRQAIRDSRTPKMQLDALDRRLGRNVGANRERNRLVVKRIVTEQS